MASPTELVQLASSLREEYIFVRAETQQLSKLNTQLTSSTENLYHQAWIARTQRRALELLLSQRSDLPADSCLHRLNLAAATAPVDGYRVLGYKESSYGECLKVVRENPELLAECLVRGERSNPEKMQEALRIVMGSLYGYGLIPEDQEYSLKLLKSLIEIQLDANSNPRRLLKNVSTFSYAYKIFVENLHETKLYLATALHQPILQVLAEDDSFLDIDASKLPFRFSVEDRKKRFGEEGTEKYEQNLREYRARIVKRLIRLAQRFVQGLVDNLFCFPPSLCWIISQVYERIESQHPSQSTLPSLICTELIFSHFICPAIVQPEPYALTSDIPVSYVARHNLMQVAQILQTLAVSKWEATDPKLRDVYGGFEQGCVWKILDVILEMRTSDILVTPTLPSDSLNRSAVLLSVTELNSLVSFVKETSADKPGSRVPSDIFRNLVHNLAPIEPPKKKEDDYAHAHLNGTVGAMHTSASKQKLKSVLLKSLDIGNSLGEGDLVSSLSSSLDSSGVIAEENQVLVISLGARETGELGLLAEQKVLAMSRKPQKRRTRLSEDHDSFEVGSIVDDEAMSAFSVCSSIPDSVSVAGPGKQLLGLGPNRFDDAAALPIDGLGAVSEEMASHHSVASSVEDVIQNDNLSDVEISPIVSGRASPSVSTGRDTPSPQGGGPALPLNVIDADLAEPAPLIDLVQPRLILPRDLPVTVRRNNREDVPEKFGKFDLPADETRSIMSDAWSTEVAGSDFGNFDPLLPAAAPLLPMNVMDDPVFAIAAAGGFDSDDDRWSVDVAASVSNASQEPLEDRMAELENEPPADPAVFREDPVPFEALPPVLPNPPGKYVSFANDDKFHHYPPEQSFSVGSHNSGGGGNFTDRSRDFEDEDPTLNLPLNVFPPVNMPFENSMGGSVPSSCSSFSNLSGFDSFESDGPNGAAKHPVLEKSASANLFGAAMDSFGQSQQQQQPRNVQFEISPKKPPIPGRKGSLSKETVTVSKEMPARQLSLMAPLATPDRVEIVVGLPSSATPSPHVAKKGSFLKNFAHNLRHKQKRSSGSKFETPPPSVEKLLLSKPSAPALGESPDDILAKYRKKAPASVLLLPASTLPQLVPMTVTDSVENVCMMDFVGISEEVMLETAKRKVRIVLNSFDPGSIPCLKMRLLSKNGSGFDPVLLSFLKIQLSEAISLQDRNLVAQLHEAIRCVKALEGRGIKRLIEALRHDYRSRDVYLTYLIRCRKTLLNSLQHIDKLVSRTKRDSDVCTKFFISSCVSQFLERHDREIRIFVRDFQKLSLSDEKTALVESLLDHLYGHMTNDTLWKSCTEQQGIDARETLERQIMSQIFRSALYPNDDVDIMRDQVLHDHMRKLAKTLTPDHKDLKISKIFHLECPWPSAQAEIATINAYKTPKDKVQCVVRCSCTLMNLLSLAADSSVPAADDFMPALVYVLIRANPPSLLSTIQYVNNFYSSRLAGEESYWWTQFASAIEYIKNMDYSPDDNQGLISFA
ncbi:GTPase-activating protein and VPS9 domain-containing protein 1 [Hypsibius exemplaris]|uniref:GTPase-activating protein and VPS9 domain-containing protein 1 n=1 Tax=Hypsibius exemplaris TaxID=2072580 RepID=A0A1W0XE82_HYPEX|nr:GTPase-activating protein and VPS9 domain-containing protein 1 [Hypsibius exemplaris]